MCALVHCCGGTGARAGRPCERRQAAARAGRQTCCPHSPCWQAPRAPAGCRARLRGEHAADKGAAPLGGRVLRRDAGRQRVVTADADAQDKAPDAHLREHAARAQPPGWTQVTGRPSLSQPACGLPDTAHAATAACASSDLRTAYAGSMQRRASALDQLRARG